MDRPCLPAIHFLLLPGVDAANFLGDLLRQFSLDEHIVNPLLFYVMNVCSCLKLLSSIMTIVTGIIFCGLGCFYIAAMIDEAELNKSLETVTKWTFFLFILFTLTYILIPGEDTLLMMQAAKLATTDNVNSVFEALKGAIDYAVSVVK